MEGETMETWISIALGFAMVYGIYRFGVWRGKKKERRAREKFRQHSGSVSERQIAFIESLCDERNLDPPADLEEMTMDEASAYIDTLKGT